MIVVLIQHAPILRPQHRPLGGSEESIPSVVPRKYPLVIPIDSKP